MFVRLAGHMKFREKALDAAWLRNGVIANNIANVDTPGFKRSIVKFEEYLDNALDGGSFKMFATDRRHFGTCGSNADNIKIKVEKDSKSLSYRLDGNNVDIESEMASLAKNDIRYNTLVQSIESGYRRLRSVITGGRA